MLSVIDKGEGLIRWAAGLGWEASRKVLAESSARGTKAHKDMESVLNGGKPETPEGIAGAKFLSESGLRVLEFDKGARANELVVHSMHFGFAGTLDAVGTASDGTNVLLDWKTSNAIRKETALQTIAYKVAFEEMHPKIKIDRRMVVRLVADGSYETKEYRDDAGDFAGFLGALSVFKWLH